MGAFTPTLQQAFDAMINGNGIILSEERRTDWIGESEQELEDELKIHSIGRDGTIALYSEEMDDVNYEITCDDILINENKVTIIE